MECCRHIVQPTALNACLFTTVSIAAAANISDRFQQGLRPPFFQVPLFLSCPSFSGCTVRFVLIFVESTARQKIEREKGILNIFFLNALTTKLSLLI